MLQHLSIRNFAIIDALNIGFGAGLNVLTGETGAGKSVIIGALTAALGGRVGAESVRAGADRAIIDAAFDITGAPAVQAEVEAQGYEGEEGLLLVTREIGSAGKSTVRINGRPATVGQLKSIGDWLVDIHGQHDHQSLLSVPRHLAVLDDWGGAEATDARAAVKAALSALTGLKQELAGLQTDARERARLVDLYEFQSKEIAAAGLRPGEDEELAREADLLSNARRLGEAASDTLALLTGSRGANAVDLLADAGRLMEPAAAIDPALSPILNCVNSARYELEEAARDLGRYGETIEDSPARLEEVHARLDLIKGLKRKYGESIEEVAAYGADVAAKLEALTDSEWRVAELTPAIARAEGALTDACAKLTALRQRLSTQFAASVSEQLRDLAMDRTRFVVEMTGEEPTARGADRVEFMMAANPGEPLRPLARIASGGEMSRMMLAIKSAMASQSPLPTMVFDEVDVGVGGRTAHVIGEKLQHLAATAQVICITHLPQIAARSAHHLVIEKTALDDRTSVTVTRIDGADRVAEVARMLGGAEDSAAAMQHAAEMLRDGAG